MRGVGAWFHFAFLCRLIVRALAERDGLRISENIQHDYYRTVRTWGRDSQHNLGNRLPRLNANQCGVKVYYFILEMSWMVMRSHTCMYLFRYVVWWLGEAEWGSTPYPRCLLKIWTSCLVYHDWHVMITELKKKRSICLPVFWPPENTKIR